jgi:hypothetical protein
MAERTNPAETRELTTSVNLNRTYLADAHVFTNPKLVDEVIAHLANAPENRRAQQIGEWERLQRHYSFRIAA